MFITVDSVVVQWRKKKFGWIKEKKFGWIKESLDRSKKKSLDGSKKVCMDQEKFERTKVQLERKPPNTSLLLF